MELVKEHMKLVHFIGKTQEQIALEEDFIVPDVKPDVSVLIAENGDVKITEARVKEGKLFVRGKLEFSVLYVAADKEKQLNKMSGSIPFEETLTMDGLSEEHMIKVRWDIEDLRTRMINSRKISVRSIIALSVQVFCVRDELAVSEECHLPGAYAKGEMLNFSQLHTQKRDILRVRGAVALPGSKPDMLDIIWGRAQPGKMQIKVLDGCIHVRGMLHVFVMYASGEDEQPLQYFGTDMEINERLDVEGATEEMIGHIEMKMIQQDLQIHQNEDGEMRKVDVEVVMEVSMALYEEKRMCLMQDAYANDRTLLPQKTQLVYDNVCMQNQSVCEVNHTLPIENHSGKVLQICQTDARVKVDQSSITPEGVKIEGVVYVQILYIAADDQIPVNVIRGVIPFEHLVETGPLGAQCVQEVIANLGDVNSSMPDSEHMEVKIELVFNTMIFEHHTMHVITDIEEKPRDYQNEEKIPSMVGYIVRQGDTLWQLAKQYATTCERVMQLNDLETEEILPGQKLLIMREPMRRM